MTEPECKYGYPQRQLEDILGYRFDEFAYWMRGQTMTLCTGAECAHPHGPVVYPWDLANFLRGRPVLD